MKGEWYRVSWEGGVFLRAGPSKKHKIVHELDFGDVFFCEGKAGYWLKLEHGWLIRKVDSRALVSPLPVIATPYGYGALVNPRGECKGDPLICTVKLDFGTAYFDSFLLRRHILMDRRHYIEKDILPVEIGIQVTTPHGEGCLILQRGDGISMIQHEYGVSYVCSQYLSPHPCYDDDVKSNYREELHVIHSILDGYLELPSLWTIVDDKELLSHIPKPELREIVVKKRPKTKSMLINNQVPTKREAKSSNAGNHRKKTSRYVEAARQIDWEVDLTDDTSDSTYVYPEEDTYSDFTAELDYIPLDDVERDRVQFFFDTLESKKLFREGYKEKSGVKFHKPLSDDSTKLLVKSSTLIPVSAEKAAAFLTVSKGYEYRMRTWDESFIEGERRLVSPFRYLCRYTLSLPIPGTARDFVVYERVIQFRNGSVGTIFWDCRWYVKSSSKLLITQDALALLPIS
uniref:Uncharacterized protein n=1 Tax=Lotharella globosa TaxID=91324 RepID=A0A7S3ZC06_9EUKA